MKQASSPSPFARRLSEARARARLSQAELAARLGVASAESISRYERGVREPRYGTVVRIAEALGIDASVLVGDLDEPRSSPEPSPESPPPQDTPEKLVSSARIALKDMLVEQPQAAACAAVAVLAIAKLSK